MVATFLNSPLKRRFMTSVLLIAGSVIAALAVLLYLLVIGVVSFATFAVLGLACILTATAVGLWLVRTVIDSFAAPLRAVTASLQKSGSELDATGFAETNELREPAAAVNALGEAGCAAAEKRGK